MASIRDAAAGSKEGNVKIPFRLRLKAWWDGHELHVRPKQKNEPGASAVVEEPPFERWSNPHLEFLQAVWGEDFITPGGPDYLLPLVKPIGLTAAMSLLEIGAGIGGHARLMAKSFGVWVSGLEGEARLAKDGMARSVKAGLEKKAPIEHFDPEHYEGKARGFDCVFAKETFYTIENKEGLLQAIEDSFKDIGHLVFTDFVLPKAGHTSPDLKIWAEGEPVTPNPWSIEQYEQALVGHKFEVRIAEDISDDYQRMVTDAWATYLTGQKGTAVDKRLAPILVEEVELWTRRIRAMEAGDLKVCRIYARRKGIGKLMSDW